MNRISCIVSIFIIAAGIHACTNEPVYDTAQHEFDSEWIMEPPAAPAIYYPYNTQMINTDMPTFKWSASDRAVSYKLEISEGGAGTDVFTQDDIEGLEYTLTVPGRLLEGGAYTWRVLAKSREGIYSASPTNFIFLVDMAAPTVTAGLDKSSINEYDSATLTWKSTEGGTYIISKSLTPDFAADSVIKYGTIDGSQAGIDIVTSISGTELFAAGDSQKNYIRVKVIDKGGNAGTADNELTWNRDRGPTLIAAETQDLDHNGLLDAVKLTFSEDIKDSSVTVTAWDIEDTSGESFNPATNGDSPDDSVIYITFMEHPLRNTSVLPTINVGANSVTDLRDNPYEGIASINSTSAPAMKDTAPPVLTSTLATVGGSYLSMTFSEPVYAGSASPSCPGNALDATDFAYHDVSLDGAASIASVTRGCGESLVQLAMNGASVAEDSADTIESKAGQIFDAAGNEAYAFNRAITVNPAGGYFKRLQLSNQNSQIIPSAIQMQLSPNTGKWLIVENSYFNIFNETTASIYGGGTSTGITIGGGTQLFRIPSGQRVGQLLLACGNNGTTTKYFNEETSAFSNGSSTNVNITNGSSYFEIKTGDNAGKILVIAGSSTSTRYFNMPAGVDPDFNTAGPAMIDNPQSGSYNFRVTSGDYKDHQLIVTNNGTTKRINYFKESDSTIIQGAALESTSFCYITPVNGDYAGKPIFILSNGKTQVYNSDGSLSYGPTITGATTGEGCHATRIDSGVNAGKWLIFLGGNTTKTKYFDESTSSFSDGPDAPWGARFTASSFKITSGPDEGKLFTIYCQGAQTSILDLDTTHFMGSGGDLSTDYIHFAYSFILTDGPNAGKRFILPKWGTTSTYIFDENTLGHSSGPALSATAGYLAFKLTSGDNKGKWMIINGSTTSIFDESSMSVTAGAGVGATVGLGSNAFMITHEESANKGKWLIICGGRTTTTKYYDEINDEFTNGPSTYTQITDDTSNPLFKVTAGPNAGKWTVFCGNSGNAQTNYFNEKESKFENGKVLTGPVESRDYITITEGTYKGKRLLICGYLTNRTLLYDETNADTPTTEGPNLTGTAYLPSIIKISAGANAGKTLVVHNNSTDQTSLFDETGYSFSPGPDVRTKTAASEIYHLFLINSGPWANSIIGIGSQTNIYIP